MPTLSRKISFPILMLITMVPFMISGCHEADYAIDFMVGKKSLAESFSNKGGLAERFFGSTLSQTSQNSSVRINASNIRNQPRSLRNHSNLMLQDDIIIVKSDALPEVDSNLQGSSIPAKPQTKNNPLAAINFDFTFPRDPFMPPSEVIPPEECLPSMPLCRYDYTQLKLRGLIRLADGQYKGMVEDPDGRGFFITPGVQIRGATVTQVTADGVIIYIHKTKRVDWLKLEGREARGR